MEVDAAADEEEEEVDEVAQAKAAAKALAKGAVDDVADELKELNMDNYDEEEEGSYESESSLHFCCQFRFGQ